MVLINPRQDFSTQVFPFIQLSKKPDTKCERQLADW